MTARQFAPGLFVRGFTPPLRLADYKLVAFDMDSTLIAIECVDEIAAMAGRKAEVAAITEAAMRGEIADYKESLRRRVALLKGGAEDAAGVGRLHLFHRPGARAARHRLRAQQRARHRERTAHRADGRPALGRHLRWRGKEDDAARDLRRARPRAGAGDRRRRRCQRPADDVGGRALGRLSRQAEGP